MATSLGANTYNRQNWEDAEFPILCQTCLGDNPYIRMTKEKYGKECKICERPFTVFRWCPGARMRFKKTEVCQTCCKLKNVCQTCLLDLEYGLPVQVRDHALQMKNEMPRSAVNQEYYTQNAERALDQAGTSGALQAVGGGKMTNQNEMLAKLARTTPYYKRNRPHICSFWVKGECKRGEECPYRHEKPSDPDDPLADQNIRDRFYGANDPVAEKLLNRASAMPALRAPEDQSVTTLFVGGITDESITEQNLRDHFYQFGEIRSINLTHKNHCAFVTFTTRIACEQAAEKSFNKLVIHGKRLTVRWGKSLGTHYDDEDDPKRGPRTAPVPNLPGPVPLPPQELVSGNDFFNLGGSIPRMPVQMPPRMGWMPPPPGMPFRIPAPGMPPGMMMRPGMAPPGVRPPMVPPTGGPPGARPGGPPRHFNPVHYPSQDPTRMGANDGAAPKPAGT